MPLTLVLAIRGYYGKTFAPDGNNVGVYDDFMATMTQDTFVTWNANTDPSRYGWNAGAGKFMARLKAGIWDFVRLKHHASRPDGYMAFGQGENPVVVERIDADGKVRLEERGCFGINLHRGGRNGTSSEGCLTIPVEQWPSFDSTLATAIKPSNRFPLLLVDQSNA
jgi:lysozyme